MLWLKHKTTLIRALLLLPAGCVFLYRCQPFRTPPFSFWQDEKSDDRGRGGDTYTRQTVVTSGRISFWQVFGEKGMKVRMR